LSDSLFAVSSSNGDGLVELALIGELDLAAIPILRDAVDEQLKADEVTGLAIDLSGLTFLDSSGIGMLLTCQRQAHAVGRTFTATGAQGIVARVLDVSGVGPHLAGAAG
jgi:anti-sigma B factor antagonist